MSSYGGNRVSREAVVAARERERQTIQLFIRGLSWIEIGRQLGISEGGARKAYDRAVKKIPPKDVETLRKLQSERLNDARRRLFGELAGREVEIPDRENPGRFKKVTKRPEVDEVGVIIGRLLNVDQHEADLYGLYAPKRAEVVGRVLGQTVSDEELDKQLARLTPEEQDTFMMLVAKLQGRWTEPLPAIEDGATVETTATTMTELNGDVPSDG